MAGAPRLLLGHPGGSLQGLLSSEDRGHTGHYQPRCEPVQAQLWAGGPCGPQGFSADEACLEASLGRGTGLKPMTWAPLRPTRAGSGKATPEAPGGLCAPGLVRRGFFRRPGPRRTGLGAGAHRPGRSGPWFSLVSRGSARLQALLSLGVSALVTVQV